MRMCSSKKEVEAYNLLCLKRYHWCDLVSGIMDAYLVYHILYRVDVTGRSKAMIESFAFLFRIYFSVKTLIHLFVVPFYALGGSISKLHILISANRTFELIAPADVLEQKTKNCGFLDALKAKAVMMNKRGPKTKFLGKAFAVVYFIALLLTLDHRIPRLLDITLMTLWFCVVSFAMLAHFVYFPDPFFFGVQGASKENEIIQHPRLSNMALVYTILMMTGWSLGNYVALLDWDEPYIFFPNANFIGICLGHFAAALFATVAISI